MKKNKDFQAKTNIVIPRKSRFSATEIRFKKAVHETIFRTLKQCWQNWKTPNNIRKGNNEEAWIVLAGEINWNQPSFAPIFIK